MKPSPAAAKAREAAIKEAEEAYAALSSLLIALMNPAITDCRR